MKAKFITIQLDEYRLKDGAAITKKGFVTEDEAMISYLRNSKDNGVWFREVPTDEEVKEKAIEQAKKLLIETGNMVVDPVSTVDIEEEEKALKMEKAIREAEQKALEEEMEKNKEKQERIKEARARASARSAK